jgi:hypothetical protein
MHIAALNGGLHGVLARLLHRRNGPVGQMRLAPLK